MPLREGLREMMQCDMRLHFAECFGLHEHLGRHVNDWFFFYSGRAMRMCWTGGYDIVCIPGGFGNVDRILMQPTVPKDCCSLCRCFSLVENEGGGLARHAAKDLQEEGGLGRVCRQFGR